MHGCQGLACDCRRAACALTFRLSECRASQKVCPTTGRPTGAGARCVSCFHARPCPASLASASGSRAESGGSATCESSALGGVTRVGLQLPMDLQGPRWDVDMERWSRNGEMKGSGGAQKLANATAQGVWLLVSPCTQPALSTCQVCSRTSWWMSGTAFGQTQNPVTSLDTFGCLHGVHTMGKCWQTDTLCIATASV